MILDLQLGSSQLLPVKEAAELVTCSRDYVTRLARENKITATLINRQWLVDIDSLKNFFAFSQYEIAVRKKHLCEIRKNELLVKQEFSEKINSLKINQDQIGTKTAVVSLTLLLCGIGTGLLLNFTNIYIPLDKVATLAQIPQSVATNFLYTLTGENEIVVYDEWVSNFGLMERTDKLLMSNGIIIFPANVSVSPDQNEIGNLFSDNTEIVMTGINTGFVRADGFQNGRSIPFVKIPHYSEPAVFPDESNHKQP